MFDRVLNLHSAPPWRFGLAFGCFAGGLVAVALRSTDPLTAVAGAGAAVLVVCTFLSVQGTHHRDMLTELRSLWSLTGALTGGIPWPSVGGWALGPDALIYLLRHITAHRPGTIVELGPGSSSVVLGIATDAEIYGLEHDEEFHEQTRQMLIHHGLLSYRLIHAPLEPTCDGIDWYSADAVDELPESIDVLVVDGPPNWRSGKNRYPAWPVLGRRLAPGGLVVVDDTHRRGERAMVRRWLADGGLELVHDGGGFMVLERRKSA